VSSTEFVQRASRYLYPSALLALLPAAISMAFAVWSAANTGQVTVISAWWHQAKRWNRARQGVGRTMHTDDVTPQL